MPQFETDDGVMLVYDEVGRPEAAPIVFAHGLASSAAQHRADAEYFAAQGFRVLVPDQRGHGRSGCPQPMSAGGFTLERLVADMAALLDHAEAGPVHWVGNSLGGIVGLTLIGKDTSRFRSFATFGTTYSLHLPRFAANSITLARAVLGRRGYARAAAIGMSRHAGAQHIIEEVVMGWDPEVGRLIGGNLSTYDLIPIARATTLPILMLRGAEDPQVNVVLGPTLRAMRDRPNFTLIDLPHAGHCANLDAPEEVRMALETFWGRANT